MEGLVSQVLCLSLDAKIHKRQSLPTGSSVYGRRETWKDNYKPKWLCLYRNKHHVLVKSLLSHYYFPLPCPSFFSKFSISFYSLSSGSLTSTIYYYLQGFPP